MIFKGGFAVTFIFLFQGSADFRSTYNLFIIFINEGNILLSSWNNNDHLPLTNDQCTLASSLPWYAWKRNL